MKIINLEIENYIIIDKLGIEFENEFNALIGQSGSGKSIIVEAISFLLYGKSKEIRKIDSQASVKAVIEIESEDDFITFTRKIRNGKTMLYVNNSFISQADFEKKYLLNVDISLQSRNQKIRNSGYLNKLIDKYLLSNDKYHAAKAKYQVKFQEYKSALAELDQLLNQPKLNEEQIKQIQQENSDIEKYLISDDEYSQLQKSQSENQKVIKSAAKVQENIVLLAQSDIVDQLRNIESSINTVTEEDEKIIAQTKNFRLELEGYQFDLEAKVDGIDMEEFEENEMILFHNQVFRKKYELYQNIIKAIKQNENSIELSFDFDKVVNKLKTKIEKLKNEAIDLGKDLSQLQIKLTQSELIELNQRAQQIGIKHDLIINTQLVDLNSNYGYEIQFLNSSQSSVLEIASGGELSRINLLLTYIFNQQSNIFVWDEIDTGISGEIGFKVGKLMAQLAKSNQIIMISHLPQVTAFANKLIWVERDQSVKIKNAKSKEQKVDMIASLLAGETKNTAAQANALQLVEDAANNE